MWILFQGENFNVFPGLNLPLGTRHNQREKDSMQRVGQRQIIQESDESEVDR